MLAQRSQELRGRYRRGETVGDECPLKKAVAGDEYDIQSGHGSCGQGKPLVRF